MFARCTKTRRIIAEVMQVQACERSPKGEEILFGYRTPSFKLAPNNDTGPELVASAILLGRYQGVRFPGWI